MGEASENNFQRQNDNKTLDDDSLLLALDSNKNRITVPNGAVDLFPRKVGPRIFYLPDRNQILKAGLLQARRLSKAPIYCCEYQTAAPSQPESWFNDLQRAT